MFLCTLTCLFLVLDIPYNTHHDIGDWSEHTYLLQWADFSTSSGTTKFTCSLTVSKLAHCHNEVEVGSFYSSKMH